MGPAEPRGPSETRAGVVSEDPSGAATGVQGSGVRSTGQQLHTSGGSIDPLAMTGTSSGQLTERMGRPGFDVEAELARDGAGARIGKYRILELLGRGGMGAVYSVYNPDLDRRSVIKLVRPDRSSADSRRRLLREARLTATLSHPNVVQIHDSGEHQDEVYVVMEFIAGQDLDAWRKRGPHAWPEVLAVYRQAGLGLAAAHAGGVVHRDFTPRNAMLGEDGRVRVLDFGLAHAASEAGSGVAGAAVEEEGLTAPGAIVGTPRYMSPEQLRAVPTDARSDQFSFCVALWEALVGHLPFMGDMQGYNEAVLAGEIWPPEDLRGVPRRVLRALRRGLSPRAEDRFPDMQALLGALEVRPLRRGRVLAAVLGVAAVGGLWVALLPTPPVSPREQCAAELGGEAGAWGTGRAALAETVAPVVLAQMDRFAERWQAARVELCAAGRAGGVTAAMQRRGLTCLEGQGAVFAAVVERMRGGAWRDLDLEQLPDADRVAGCADPLRLGGEEVPASAAVREAAGRIAGELARAEAALIVGAYRESEAIAAGALRRARALGHEPTLAAALYQLARAETYGPRAGLAEATLREAAELAERHDLHDLAADVYLRLVRVAMAHGQRSADGEVWFAVLGFKLARLGERRGRRWAEGLEYLGMIALDARALAAAEDFYRRAGAAQDDASGFRRGLVAFGLARVARLRGDVPGAVLGFTLALALTEAELGPQAPKLVPMLANLGEAQILAGELAAARATIDRALAIEAEAGSAGVFMAQLLIDSAHLLELGGELQAAGALARRARDLLRDPALPGDVRSYRGVTLDLVARAALAAGDSSAALDAYRELLAAPEGHLSREAARLTIAYNNAAHVALGREQPALALRFTGAAGPLLAGLGGEHEGVRVELAVSEAEALLASGRPAAAVGVAERALERWDPEGRREDAATADLHLVCFEVWKESAPAQAGPHARAALRYFAGEPPPRAIAAILEGWLRRYPGPVRGARERAKD